MEILQVPEARKLAAAYSDGHITLTEFMDELQWCWHKRTCGGTKVRVVEWKVFKLAPTLDQDR
jgi:hypothetical protein